jgi:hypothetical protein
MIPAQLAERLSTALVWWDGRGPTDDDTLEAGRALASAAMAVLVWNSAHASEEPRVRYPRHPTAIEERRSYALQTR